MRWPRPLLPLLLSHPFSTSLSLADELAASVPQLSSLRRLSPFLDSRAITKALLSLSSPLPAFRLYLFASSHPHLFSLKSFEHMVTLFLNHPDSLPHALDFIKQVKSDARCNVSAAAFEPLIAAYAKSGKSEKAVEVFERMLPDFGCQPNSWVYYILLKIFVDNGLVLLAMAVYNQMLKLNCIPTRCSYAVVMDGLCKTGMVNDALQLFDEMTRRGVYPDASVYNIFINSACRAENFDDATRLLNSMKAQGFEPRNTDFTSVLSGLCKSGRVDDAFALLENFQHAGFVLGLEGYSSLIGGLFRAERVDEASWYFRKMLNENVKPDVVIYTIMIKGYANAGRVENCFLLLNEMTDRGIVPDTVCYNVLIKALCDAGQLDRAQSLQLEMSKNNVVPDAATYSTILDGLCNAGMVDEAQKIFNRMPSLGIQPTIHSYNSLVNGLCKAGLVKQAQLLLYKMEMGRNPSLFLSLLQGKNQVRDSASLRKRIDDLCESGQVLKAYKLLYSIRNSGVMPDIIIYNTLINGFCKIGDIDGALKLFKELQIKGHSPDKFTYCKLVSGLFRAGREEDANKIFEHLVRTGFKPIFPVYYQLMRRLIRKKRVVHGMKHWLDYLAQECTEVETSKAISDIRAHFEKESFLEAIRGLLELDQVHGSVGPPPYTLWLVGFCLARKVDKAFEIYMLLREYGVDLTPHSCSVLIDHLCLTNKLGWSVHLVLYAVKKRFVLLNKRGIDRLIQKLCLQNCMPLAQLVISRLCVAGYNLDKYLRNNTTKLLLKSEEKLVEFKVCRG